MRILILGAGAVGGYFGGRLIEAGVDVTFLVREPRAQQLARDGLVIESSYGDFKQPVKTITSCEAIEPPDIAVVACKAYGLEGALEAISPCIRAETIILPLLNGIAHLEIIEQRFPQATLWGGMAHIGVTLSAQGVVKHFDKRHILMFGPRDGASNALADELRDAFAKVPADAQLRQTIFQDMWDKMVFLSTLAACTCLMRADVGTILATADGEGFILQVLDEAEKVAAAEGYAPRAEQLADYRSQLTNRSSTSTASMLRDLEKGGPTEGEHILGDMVARAHNHGIAVPGFGIALTHLRAYELRRSQG